MYELKIKQIRPYKLSDGTEGSTTERITLYFNNMENVTTAMNLAMIGSKEEISFEIREIEEGQIYED